MATIHADPDLLKAKANELRGLKANHDEAMAKMRTLIMSLNEIWKGDAQTAFINKYESMQPTFNSFSEMIEGYAKQMDNAGAYFKETDDSLANGTNNS